MRRSSSPLLSHPYTPSLVERRRHGRALHAAEQRARPARGQASRWALLGAVPVHLKTVSASYTLPLPPRAWTAVRGESRPQTTGSV